VDPRNIFIKLFFGVLACTLNF